MDPGVGDFENLHQPPTCSKQVNANYERNTRRVTLRTNIAPRCNPRALTRGLVGGRGLLHTPPRGPLRVHLSGIFFNTRQYTEEEAELVLPSIIRVVTAVSVSPPSFFCCFNSSEGVPAFAPRFRPMELFNAQLQQSRPAPPLMMINEGQPQVAVAKVAF